MTSFKLRFKSRELHRALVFFMTAGLCLLLSEQTARAQTGGTVETGTTIPVRTNEAISAGNSDGRVFSGSVDQDVRDSRGEIAIPRGSYVELLVKRTSAREYVLDIDSVTINGRRLAVDSTTSVRAEKEGLGINDRTGKYVGGGAVIGAIVGALTGGGKGAAIGAGAGAAAGAGAQVLTRGQSVNVPSESLVTFRLEQPLKTSVDTGFSRNGNHYHSGYGTSAGNSSPYETGLKAGRADRQASHAFNSQSRTFNGANLSDYQSGYERGFDESPSRSRQGSGQIRIGSDHYVTWKGPAASQVYVQVDDNPRRLFSRDASGNQPAPWISYGHRYVFVLEDPNGKEIARDENDLRERRSAR